MKWISSDPSLHGSGTQSRWPWEKRWVCSESSLLMTLLFLENEMGSRRNIFRRWCVRSKNYFALVLYHGLVGERKFHEALTQLFIRGWSYTRHTREKDENYFRVYRRRSTDENSFGATKEAVGRATRSRNVGTKEDWPLLYRRTFCCCMVVTVSSRKGWEKRYASVLSYTNFEGRQVRWRGIDSGGFVCKAIYSFVTEDCSFGGID